MLHDLTKRAEAILGSVVTFVTALAASVTLFIAEVAPELPNGWQDDTFRWGGVVTTVLLSAAAAIRRVTKVPAEARGLTMPDHRQLVVEVVGPPKHHVPPS